MILTRLTYLDTKYEQHGNSVRRVQNPSEASLYFVDQEKVNPAVFYSLIPNAPADCEEWGVDTEDDVTIAWCKLP